MTVRENLIPDDMPYGERQAQREALSAAGLPSETGIQTPAIPGATMGSASGTPSASTLSGQGDAEGDPFGGGDLFDQLEPSTGLSMPAPVDPMDRIRTIRDSTNNPFMAMVLTRLIGDQ